MSKTTICLRILDIFLQILIEYSALSTHIPRLHAKKVKGERIEFLQANIGYYKNFILIKKDIMRWLQIEKCNIFRNILQV